MVQVLDTAMPPSSEVIWVHHHSKISVMFFTKLHSWRTSVCSLKENAPERDAKICTQLFIFTSGLGVMSGLHTESHKWQSSGLWNPARGKTALHRRYSWILFFEIIWGNQVFKASSFICSSCFATLSVRGLVLFVLRNINHSAVTNLLFVSWRLAAKLITGDWSASRIGS